MTEVELELKEKMDRLELALTEVHGMYLASIGSLESKVKAQENEIGLLKGEILRKDLEVRALCDRLYFVHGQLNMSLHATYGDNVELLDPFIYGMDRVYQVSNLILNPVEPMEEEDEFSKPPSPTSIRGKVERYGKA